MPAGDFRWSAKGRQFITFALEEPESGYVGFTTEAKRALDTATHEASLAPSVSTDNSLPAAHAPNRPAQRAEAGSPAFPRTALEGDIENEPPAAALPPRRTNGSQMAWLGLFLLLMIGLAIGQRKRSMRGKWR
jgi:hypothetical protein